MTAKPEIPINVAELKQLLREGLEDQSSRAFWWPILPGIIKNQKRIDEDPDIIGAAERLQVLINEPLLEYTPSVSTKSEKDVGGLQQMVKKLSLILVRQKKIEESQLGYIEALQRLIVWQIKRIDVSYLTMTEILSKPER